MAEFCETCPLAGDCTETIAQVETLEFEILTTYDFRRLRMNREFVSGAKCIDVDGNVSEAMYGVDAQSLRSRVDTCPRKGGGGTPDVERAPCDALRVHPNAFRDKPYKAFACVIPPGSVDPSELYEPPKGKPPIIFSDKLPYVEEEIRKAPRWFLGFSAVGGVFGPLIAYTSHGNTTTERIIIGAVTTAYPIFGGVMVAKKRIHNAVENVIPKRPKNQQGS